MLLMLEPDFPDGKNPEFCAKLFREEPGVWKLKMEQFKRWLEKGKNDPLPEYYGTGKNCSVCGVFLFDTKSYLKHMKRNHGYKIKEKDKQLLKSEKKEKSENDIEDDFSPPPVKPTPESAPKKIPTKAELKAKDPFDLVISGSLPSTSRAPPPPLPKTRAKDDDSDLDDSPDVPEALVDDKEEDLGSRSTPDPAVSSTSRRRATQKQEFKDEMVTCPECDFQCLHSKIVSHLKKCTKKMAQKSKPEKHKNVQSSQVSSKDSVKSRSKYDDFEKEEVKKPKDSEIVKKVFLKKFEAQQKKSKLDYFSDSDAEPPPPPEPISDHENDKAPSLKLKFSRKESSSDTSHFEVSNDNIENVEKNEIIDTSRENDESKETSLSAILKNLNAERSVKKPPLQPLPQISPPPKEKLKEKNNPLISPPKEKSKEKNHDDSSDDEVIPQKSFRLHSFIESLRAMQARVPQKKEEPAKEEPKPIPDPEPEPSPKATPSESSHLKNKWLQSLENRSKVKPPDPTPAVNKIQSDIAQLRDKNSLIFSKAKLKSYPDSPPKAPAKESSLEISPVKPEPTSKKSPEEPVGVKEKVPEEPKEQYHDGRPSLRKGKMIPCPICGAEYAIADNLQKHIDKDHFGETDRVFLKRVKPKDNKEKDKAEPARKKKKMNSLTNFEDDDDDLLGDSRPVVDNKTAEEKFDSLIASGSSSSSRKDKHGDREPSPDREKLTEYEIFQKLQLAIKPKEKKKVECSLGCGKSFPVNTIKRHMLKCEKDSLAANQEEPEDIPEKPKPKPKATKPKKVQRKKAGPSNTVKKKEAKLLIEKKEVNNLDDKDKEDAEEFVDERIPCPHCNKMFPKMIMKRHLMKHETVSESSDNEKVVEIEEETTTDGPSENKTSKGRKKIGCSECGLSVAPNVLKRHLDKHSKQKEKRKEEETPEMFAPIEITPTKEYWEYEKEKNNKSLDFPSESEQSAEEADVFVPYKKSKKELKPKGKKDFVEPINKSLQDLKEAEKSRNTSEEESESENPLEAAVRKVVTYRMTPKQALSHYNLTPKVCFILFTYLFQIFK